MRKRPFRVKKLTVSRVVEPRQLRLIKLLVADYQHIKQNFSFKTGLLIADE